MHVLLTDYEALLFDCIHKLCNGILVFLQLVSQIQRPLVDLSSQIPALIHATASIDRLMELEALPAEEPLCVLLSNSYVSFVL